MNLHPNLLDSIGLAYRGHLGQKRKFGGDRPYIVHPRSVFYRLTDWADTKADLTEKTYIRMACVAWKHDLKEDCPQITDQEIAEAGGEFNTLPLTAELTNPSKQRPDLNRKARKEMDRDHLRHVSWEAKILKMIDRTDNLDDTMTCEDWDWLALYARESFALLEVVGEADDGLATALRDRIGKVERRAKQRG